MDNLADQSFAEKMIKTQIIARGIKDTKVIKAIKSVPRHLFVNQEDISQAYGDFPLPIGFGQTISQPYIVALMTELLSLEKNDRVLEVGTGSGYQTAILASLAARVFSIDRIAELSHRAKKIHADLGMTNIEYKIGDGSLGWSDKAPFDKMLITAAAPSIINELKKQLADKGRLVIPVGDYHSYQHLMIVTRRGSHFTVTKNIGCRFVPLIGEMGF